MLTFATTEPHPIETLQLLERFATVFDGTYTRFLDLKKAEAQAREAEFKLALERVRARTMTMQKSSELPEISSLLFQQLKELGVTAIQNSIGIVNEETGFVELSTTIHGSHLLHAFNVPIDEKYLMAKAVTAWKAKRKSLTLEFKGQELKNYNELRNSFLQTKVNFPEDQWIVNISFFLKGWLSFSTDKNIPGEIIVVLQRFASVFEQTYSRFLDLQKAEAQVREAIKASSLDRVRGEIASMRNADDLHRITPLVWRELTALGVPFFRCGVMIIHEQEEKVEFYLSTPDGKPLAALNLSFEDAHIIRNPVINWRLQKVFTDHWDKEQFIANTKLLIEKGQIETANTYQGGEEPPQSISLQFVPFKQGMMYVGSAEPLTKLQVDLVQALANAFSVAYARYEDFTNLEAAKKQVENTLKILQATQKQLIQSEKMASLGELTAGIAHEIQNPLNFVNNFSEVSNELIDEMNDELNKGDIEEARVIANDIKQNLEKINHHGRRADAIVKGMLQHSGTGRGVKEATDINTLADEYIRLCYHGLRSKDKNLPAGQTGFNATIKTNFDNTLQKVNIIPQDIGRVVLNLLTNAFYAANEKKQLNINGYEPTVSVCTKKMGDVVEIKIVDNGNGIPQKIVDKIFQPFFTTKPTGLGTGLGLSLAYDIVKAHGGEIKVETKDGEGSTFVI